ncbi:hypothetical protein JCM6882_000589 [Rhodosporidiobolus microsporus]
MTAPAPSSATHLALATLLPPALLAHSHPLRVTSQSSLNNLVGFSLAHLRHRSPAPLVLHCLPSPTPPSSSVAQPTPAPPPAAALPVPAGAPSDKRDKAAETSVAALPKLVSVCEIIKREWFSVPLSSVPSSSTSAPERAPSPSLREPGGEEQRRQEGLHHYSLLTTLEALALADPERRSGRDREEKEMEEAEAELVKMNWLTGGAGRRKRPRRKHSPCMIIVLSPSPLPSLSSKSWTYQPPSPPPKPKKRTPTTEEGENADGDEAQKKKRRRRRRKGGKAGISFGSSCDGDQVIAPGQARRDRYERRSWFWDGKEGGESGLSSSAAATPRRPNILARAVAHAMAPLNRMDLRGLERHWGEVNANTEGYSEPDRLSALLVAAPSLAARWVDTAVVPFRRGEGQEEWERRVRGRLWRKRRELHNAEADLRLSEKKLKYLRKAAGWAFPPSSHIPLDRHAFPNSGPAWLDQQGRTLSNLSVRKDGEGEGSGSGSGRVEKGKGRVQ